MCAEMRILINRMKFCKTNIIHAKCSGARKVFLCHTKYKQLKNISKETLEKAVVTLEMEQIKGFNP